jgi:hypothetical protein
MVEIFDNIRKIYRFGTPGAELAEHIEFFAESSIEATQQFAPHAEIIRNQYKQPR